MTKRWGGGAPKTHEKEKEKEKEEEEEGREERKDREVREERRARKGGERGNSCCRTLMNAATSWITLGSPKTAAFP